MKHFILSTLSFMCMSLPALASIQGVSNISDKRVAVNAYNADTETRKLVLLNLKTLEQQSITLPDLEHEEIMGLVLLKDDLVMISQWTSGGGKNPNVHQYNLTTQKWADPIEVHCLSFDEIEIKKSILKLNCDDKKAKPVKLSIKTSSPLKQVLPLVEQKNENVQLKLIGGSLFNWNSLEFVDGKKAAKKLKSKDFFKPKE